MSSESESWNCGVALRGEEFRKESKISYTRDFLLAVAEMDVCRQLPTGFDQSILSELGDAYNSQVERYKPQGHYSFTSGAMLGDSTPESPERWDSCKLSSKDSGRHCDNQYRHSQQNPEHNGILGSWSGSKLGRDGSEVSPLNLQRTDNCLLSRCSEPYRPPSYYKALSESGTQTHDSFKTETFGYAECPGKERALEESWRKVTSGSASIELMRNEQLQASSETQKSNSDDQKENSNQDTCAMLEKYPALPVLNENENPPISSTVSGSSDPPGFTHGAAEKYLRKESLISNPIVQVKQLPSESQSIELDSGAPCSVEKLEGQILEGAQLFALDCLEEVEDLDPEFVTEANLEANDTFRHGQSVIMTNVDGNILKKTEPMNFMAEEQKGIDIVAKELNKGNTPTASGPDHSAARANLFDESVSEIWQSSHCSQHHDVVMDGGHGCESRSKFVHWFSDTDKTAGNISSWGDQNGKKVWGESSGMSIIENFLDQGQSMSTSIYATKTDISDSPTVRNNCFAYGIKHDANLVLEPQLDEVTRNQALAHSSGEVSSFQSTERSRLNPISNFCDKDDSNFEICLPDEDSLITVDDTFIFRQDVPLSSNISSSFPGSNKLVGSERFHRNLSSQHPLFHQSQSQINAQELFGNPLYSQAHLKAPLPFHNPLKIYPNDHNPFPVDRVLHPFGRLSVDTRKYEPRMQQSRSLFPHLGGPFSAEPSIYRHFDQIPCSQQEPTPLESLALNYWRNVNSTMEVGKRGFLGEEGSKSTLSRVLQLQMRAAQMNLEAVDCFDPRAHGKPISKQFW